MARASDDPQFRAWVDRARDVPLGDYAERRGLHLRGRTERSGPCPNCGGTDRFNLNTVKGVWFCRRCAPQRDGKAGGVVDFVMWLDGCDFLRACETLTGEAPPRGEGSGLSPEELAKAEAARTARIAASAAQSEAYRVRARTAAFNEWKAAKPAKGSPVEAYLERRRCSLPPLARLKFAERARLWAGGKSGAVMVHGGPAMLAAIIGPDGRFFGLHTTWIDLEAADGKVRIADPETGELVPAKKVHGSQLGGRIELVRHAEPRRLIMGEGIETTLSMHDDLAEAKLLRPSDIFWAGINLGNIGGPAEATIAHPTLRDRAGRPRKIPGPTPAGEGIPIPESVDEIVLLGDGDSDRFTVETTLTRASHRWARPGRTIRMAMAPAGTDFNNLRRGAR